MPNSDAEFVSKIDAGRAELEETAYWLELLSDSDSVASARLEELRGEANELLAILVTCVKKVKHKPTANHDA